MSYVSLRIHITAFRVRNYHCSATSYQFILDNLQSTNDIIVSYNNIIHLYTIGLLGYEPEEVESKYGPYTEYECYHTVLDIKHYEFVKSIKPSLHLDAARRFDFFSFDFHKLLRSYERWFLNELKDKARDEVIEFTKRLADLTMVPVVSKKLNDLLEKSVSEENNAG